MLLFPPPRLGVGYVPSCLPNPPAKTGGSGGGSPQGSPTVRALIEKPLRAGHRFPWVSGRVFYPPGPILESVFLWPCFCRQRPPCTRKLVLRRNVPKDKIQTGRFWGSKRPPASSAPGARETLPKGGGRSPPPFKRVSRGSLDPKHKIKEFFNQRVGLSVCTDYIYSRHGSGCRHCHP